MKIINISVKDKIAQSPKATIVCGNSDYSIAFDFDAEWDAYKVKTARFISGGGYQDVVFEGDSCPVPILRNVSLVAVGVYAGELHTTTPALIGCRKSVLCKEGPPIEPQPDVYAQLMQLINDGVLKGEQGEKGEKGEKGDKGDAGVIKFIPVNVLPTADIDGSAIYLVPIENSEEENKYTEYAYINGAWERLGEISVQVDHSEYVKFTDIMSHKNVGVASLYEGSYGGIAIKDGKLCLLGSPYSTLSDAFFKNPKDYGVAVTSNYLYRWIKVGLTQNTETWTDEEKASACDLFGAVKQIAYSKDSTMQGSDAGCTGRAYVRSHKDEENSIPVYVQAKAWSIMERDANGNTQIQDPTLDYHCANKRFVVNLPDKVTLTEEQKAKWRAMLGIE